MSTTSRNSLLASVLACGIAMAVLLVAPSEAQRAQAPTGAGAAAAAQDDDERAGDDERADDEAGGPPAWAQNGKDKAHGPDKAWKEAWKKLTPAQKLERMAALSKAHREGMEKWADCIAAAGEDEAKREGCVKPLPPGQAKKLPS